MASHKKHRVEVAVRNADLDEGLVAEISLRLNVPADQFPYPMQFQVAQVVLTPWYWVLVIDQLLTNEAEDHRHLIRKNGLDGAMLQSFKGGLAEWLNDRIDGASTMPWAIRLQAPVISLFINVATILVEPVTHTASEWMEVLREPIKMADRAIDALVAGVLHHQEGAKVAEAYLRRRRLKSTDFPHFLEKDCMSRLANMGGGATGSGKPT